LQKGKPENIGALDRLEVEMWDFWSAERGFAAKTSADGGGRGR
jgi:hypothetical protein